MLHPHPARSLCTTSVKNTSRSLCRRKRCTSFLKHMVILTPTGPPSVSRPLFSTPGPDIIPNSENIKVYLRIRPFTAHEERDDEHHAIRKLTEQSIEVSANAAIGKYYFDSVFDEDTSTKDIFAKTTQGLVRATFKGKSSLVFAYGITNAGKTYTVHGTEADEGLLPRTIRCFFDYLDVLNNERSDGQDVEGLFGSMEAFKAIKRDSEPQVKYTILLSCLEVCFHEVSCAFGLGRESVNGRGSFVDRSFEHLRAFTLALDLQ